MLAIQAESTGNMLTNGCKKCHFHMRNKKSNTIIYHDQCLAELLLNYHVIFTGSIGLQFTLNVTRPTDTEIEVGIRSKVHIENE